MALADWKKKYDNDDSCQTGTRRPVIVVVGVVVMVVITVKVQENPKSPKFSKMIVLRPQSLAMVQR